MSASIIDGYCAGWGLGHFSAAAHASEAALMPLIHFQPMVETRWVEGVAPAQVAADTPAKKKAGRVEVDVTHLTAVWT
jgi:hypothetical protein